MQRRLCARWLKKPGASHTGLFVLVCPAEPLSSVSSLEVHFDLLDLTELTDMSDQELAEVFVDSDEENHNEPRAGEPDDILLLPTSTSSLFFHPLPTFSSCP